MTKENSDGFAHLCEKYYERILKYCYLKTGCQEDARDLVQEVFIIACKKQELLAEHENPLGFLYKTASNLCYERIRQKRKENPCDMTEQEICSGDEDILTTIVRDKDQCINEARYRDSVLSVLKDMDRRLYEEYYVQHIPMKEIARIHQMSQTSLRMRYVRIRRKVKEQISKTELVENEDVTFYLGKHI